MVSVGRECRLLDDMSIETLQAVGIVRDFVERMALVHLVQPRISAFRLGRPLRPTSSHALAQFAAKPHMAIELLSVEPLEITTSCAKCMQNCLLEFENILKLTRRD